MNERPSDLAAVKLFGDGSSPAPASYLSALGALERAGKLKPDSYARGGSVSALERRVAALLGKESAVYSPTGTLANLLALRALSGGPGRVVAQALSHLHCDAGDGAAALAGLTLLPLEDAGPGLPLPLLKRELARARSARVAVRVAAVSAELPVRRLFNRAMPFSELSALSRLCREGKIPLHLDGARLFIAAAAQGVPPRRYAELCDTVYISLYKYLGAPAGAVLAGPRALLAGMADVRRMFGGSPNQSYLQAALALQSLEGIEKRCARALSAGKEFFQRLAAATNGALEIFPDGTNTALLRIGPGRAARLSKALEREGVLLGPYAAEAGALPLAANETLLRRPLEEVASLFDRAWKR